MKQITSHLRPYRKLTWVATAIGLAGLLAQTTQAQYALPFYEPFPASYTNGGTTCLVNGDTEIGRGLDSTNAMTVWTFGANSFGAGNPTNCSGAKLSYPGLYQSDGSVGLWMDSLPKVSGGRTRGVQIQTISSGKLYTSFLLNVQKWPTTASREFAELNSNAGATGGSDFFGVFISGTNSTLGTSNRVFALKRTASNTNDPPLNAPTIDAGTTHLIVARYTFNPALTNDDEVALWVDPSQASLAVPEGSVPAPAITTTNGSDIASFSSFQLRHNNDTQVAGSGLFIDEVRIGTSWADVTATNFVCNSAGIVSSPVNVTNVEGGQATFTAIVAGANPTLQWQASTDGGTTWNNVTGGIGFNSATLLIPDVTLADNGKKYRCHASVSCNNTFANSASATLTVTNPIITPVGVVMDDTWADHDRGNAPVTSANSVWYASAGSSLATTAASDPPPTHLIGTPPGDGSAAVWVGYFTSTNAPPVHIDVGRALQATLVLSCPSIVSGTNQGFRVGLYDYYDGGVRLTNDGQTAFNSGSGGAAVGVRGDMVAQLWDTIFPTNEPLALYARSTLNDNNLMGTTASYSLLGHGPPPMPGAPGFTANTNYTLNLYVARLASSGCQVTYTIEGAGTNYVASQPDTNYWYHRFDSIGIRPDNNPAPASEFDIYELKVQVLQLPPAPTLNIQRANDKVILSWTPPPVYAPFRLVSAPAVTGPYTGVASATNPYTNAIAGSQAFFRLQWP